MCLCPTKTFIYCRVQLAYVLQKHLFIVEYNLLMSFKNIIYCRVQLAYVLQKQTRKEEAVKLNNQVLKNK